MSVDTIRVVLGRLQHDPASAKAWEELAEIVTAPGAPPDGEALRLIEQARSSQEKRREWGGVAKFLEMEISLSENDEPAMQAELARIFDEELFDAVQARAAYERLVDMLPNADLMEKAEAFLEGDEAKRAKWRELYDRYLSEAESASEDSLRAGLLIGAVDVAVRYGDEGARKSAADLVERALAHDPKVRRGAAFVHATLSDAPERAAKALELVLARGPSKDDRVVAGLRAGRIRSALKDRENAIRAYEQVLDLSPGHPDALSYLAEAYTQNEQWDHLVALYEDQLKSGARGDAELGALLQIAMVHWRMRKAPEAAEPYFERVRRSDPTHAGMLGFFRELYAARGERAKLVHVLTDAQRAISDPAAKKALASEIAQLAELQDDAQKAIEQYKALLKVDPNDTSAREALKRLYTQTSSWAALVDLLRHALERVAPDDKAGRVHILSEMAEVHRDRAKNESALVQILQQLIQLDDTNQSALRELIGIYEPLGRFRDLLTCQQRLAEITTDDDEKAELYRAVARRWGDQFSNVQNAIGGYEGLLAVRPGDAEARSKLRELYTKRRAWPQLYGIYELELPDAEGAAKVEILTEMAKLAAERLDRGADAIGLMRQILEVDPTAPGVFDTLEKQAEREKDYVTLADVLEKRAAVTTDPTARLSILQKLGTVYSDRLREAVAATRTWKRVLELAPGQAKALRVLRESYIAAGDLDGLQALYASQEDWDGLADFLSSSADKATDPAQRAELSFRAAAVYEQELGAPERATRSYERILGVDPHNARAARALVPMYEAEERWARLPPLYEILLSVAADVDERVAILRKLASVTSGPLADRGAALGYARRAYDLSPDEENLDALEQVSRAVSSWTPFVEALEAQVQKPEGVSPELVRSLRLKLANAYARELGKIDEAVAVYRKLAEIDPTDAEMLAQFDALLRSTERKDDLRWLFTARIQAAPDSERASIYEEWATLEEDVFANPKDAIQLYRKAAEIDPERSNTLRALSRLLLADGDHAGAAEVIARHRDLSTGTDRAQREVELAFLSIDHLGKPRDALASCEAALELKPRDPDAVTILARLMEVPETRARAATVLQAAYAELGDARREAQALRVMIECEQEPGRRLDLHRELADVEEQKLASPGAAFDVVLRAINEAPDNLDLWERANELSGRAGRPTDLAEAYRAHVLTVEPTSRQISDAVELELCDRAATMHDEQLGDSDGALPYLKRILAMEPSNERAFGRLKQILTAAEKWGELEDLFGQAAQSAEDPTQKIALLAEVALIAEEVIGLPQKAIGYHEQILAIDPLHVPSLDALEKLYEDEERFGDLATLLEKRLETAIDDEAVDIRLYLGRLYLEQLLAPERALGHVEEILRSRPEDPDARELAERMLEIGSLKLRAATLLESVYEGRDDIRSLVKMLEIRLEASEDPAERMQLLRRIGELRNERLNDDPGAFGALARLLPLVPDDEGVRERLVEIGRRLSLFDKLADVLTASADAAESNSVKSEILVLAASIVETSLSDRERAEAIYRKVLAIDPDDATIAAPAARALARLQAESGSHAGLAETLEIEVKLEESVDGKKALYERLGDLYESMLDDKKKAIVVWRARLADDSGDEKALTALERLYEAEGMYRDLVTVLRAREEVASDDAERRRVMVKAAQTLAGKLDDVVEATQAWRAVVETFGPDRAAHAALASLYEKAQRWPDLADVLADDLAQAEEIKDKVALLGRLGDVRRVHLADLTGALEAYKEALEFEPEDAKVRAALEALLAEPDAKRRAAELLHPLYEADGDAKKLLLVLEIEAEVAEGPADRIEKLEKALATAEGPLADPDKAYEYARRLVREAPGDDSIGRQVETLERLTAATGRWADTVALLRDIAPDLLDGDVQLSVLLRTGELYETRLNDPAQAIEHYKKALEARPEERRAMLALEALYDKQGDAPALLEILKRRAEVAENDDERKELLFREAELLRTKIEDRGKAIESLEAVLEVDVDERATKELEVLYLAEARYTDLVVLYERMLEVAPHEAHTGTKSAWEAGLRVKIAKIARGKLNDSSRAFDELSEALVADSANADAIAELEAILASGPAVGADVETPAEPTSAEDRARAGEALEPIYLKRASWKDVKRALDARLEASLDPTQRMEILKRLATLHEEQLEDYSAALETTAKLLHEDVRDRAVWSELERLARVGSAERRLAEIYAAELESIDSDDPTTAELAKRTGEIFADVKEVEQALRWLRRAHAFEPESEPLFDAIEKILRAENRHAELVELMRAALDFREGDRRLKLLYAIAELEETKLEKLDAAIESYRAALDVDPSATHALDRLTELYKKLERHRDLADLYERRAEAAETPVKGAPYRLSLARLYLGSLSDIPGAIDQLESIVTQVPGDTAAIAELEKLSHVEEYKSRVVEILLPLYEGSDDWRRLVQLNSERLHLATDKRDKASIHRETAKLLENKGNDLRGAFEAVQAALVVDAEDDDTRSELERLARALGAFSDLAASLEAALGTTEDEIVRRDLLSTLARVYDKDLNDPRKALGTFERLADASPGEASPLDASLDLAVLLGDWLKVTSILEKKATEAGDGEAAKLLSRLGQTRAEMLDDEDGAVKAFERALELEPDRPSTVDRLIALYESKNLSQRLVELYARRIELAAPDELDLRYDLATRSAARFEGPLDNRRDAIAALGDALEAKPGDTVALKGLERLFRAEKMWDDLLDNLKEQAARASDVGERAMLRVSIGDLHKNELDAKADALAQYRLVLEEIPEDTAEPSGTQASAITGALSALRAIAESDDDLRLEATDVVLPVLRSTGRHRERVEILELRIKGLTDPEARAASLSEMAKVLDKELTKPSEALGALLRAVAETPMDTALHAEIERMAGALVPSEGETPKDGFTRYADVLQERASGTTDSEVARLLWTRLGRISEENLEDAARAATAYAKALEHSAGEDGERDVLAALDRLYGKLNSHKELAEILERRTQVEKESEQATLLYRLAKLQIGVFSEPQVGLGTLRVAIEKDPAHAGAREELEKLTESSTLFEEVAETLGTVYRQAGDNKALASLFEKRIGFATAPSDRLRLRLELAKVLEDQANDPAAALSALLVAAAEDPSDSDLLAEIERVAAATGSWKTAAEAMEKAIPAHADLSAETAEGLWMRVAGWRKDKIDDLAGAEKNFEEALKHDPQNEVILRAIEQIQRSPGRERDLVATLRRLARLDGIPNAAELRKEAKSIAQEQISDLELTEALLREMIAADEADAWALAELTSVRRKAGDSKETYALLVRRTELAGEASAVRELRHEAAEVARRELKDANAAIDLYELIFDSDPTDERAPAALRELYEETGKRRELLRLIARLVDVADTADKRATLRLEAARVSADLDETSEAIDQARAVLNDDPAHREAALMLSRLFEKTGRDDDLAELLSSQLKLAQGRDDLAGELAYRLRLGEVQEGRLGNLEKAAETFSAILEKDDKHVGALVALARIQEKRGEKAVAGKFLERLLALEEGAAAVATVKKLVVLFESLKDEEGTQRVLERGLSVDERDEEIRSKLRHLYEKREDWVKLAELVLGDARAATETADKVRLLKQAAEIQGAKIKNVTAAADLLKEASDMVPDDRDMLLALCDAYSDSGRGKQAVEVLQKIVESYGARRPKEVATIHHRLARAHLADGDRAQALAELDTAFKIDPGAIAVLRDLGVLSLELADSDPSQKDAYVDRAGKTFRALLLQRLDDGAPITKAEVFYYLADISHRQGDDKKAIQMLERSLDNNKNFARAKELLAKLKA